jgi:hypothetical protein
VFIGCQAFGFICPNEMLLIWQFQMKEDKSCVFVCRHEKLSGKSVKAFKDKIEDEYRVNMILDNLPVAMRRTRDDGVFAGYDRGFHVGFKALVEVSVQYSQFQLWPSHHRISTQSIEIACAPFCRVAQSINT